MSVITTCGGYDKAKIYVAEFKKLNLGDAAGIFERELLEYRRDNNIYEKGDKITIKHNRILAGVYEVKAAKNDKVLIDFGSGDFFLRYKGTIQHATDEEIAAGHRL